jgi:hypothetical protein
VQAATARIVHAQRVTDREGKLHVLVVAGRRLRIDRAHVGFLAHHQAAGLERGVDASHSVDGLVQVHEQPARVRRVEALRRQAVVVHASDTELGLAAQRVTEPRPQPNSTYQSPASSPAPRRSTRVRSSWISLTARSRAWPDCRHRGRIRHRGPSLRRDPTTPTCGAQQHWGRFRGSPPNGRYWARTSDPQLVELVLSQLS